jgi:hypothetical protein
MSVKTSIFRLLAVFPLALLSLSARGGTCRIITPDVEVRCPYHPLDPARHDVVFVDLSEDYSLRAASVRRPDDPHSDLIFDSLRPDSGWVGLATFFSPSLERAIVMRPASPRRDHGRSPERRFLIGVARERKRCYRVWWVDQRELERVTRCD